MPKRTPEPKQAEHILHVIWQLLPRHPSSLREHFPTTRVLGTSWVYRSANPIILNMYAGHTLFRRNRGHHTSVEYT